MKQVTSWSPTIVTQLGHKWLPSISENPAHPQRTNMLLILKSTGKWGMPTLRGGSIHPGGGLGRYTLQQWLFRSGQRTESHPLGSIFLLYRPWPANGVWFPCSLFFHLVSSRPSCAPGNLRWIVLSLEQYMDEEMMRTLDSRVWLWTQTLAPATQLLCDLEQVLKLSELASSLQKTVEIKVYWDHIM